MVGTENLGYGRSRFGPWVRVLGFGSGVGCLCLCSIAGLADGLGSGVHGGWFEFVACPMQTTRNRVAVGSSVPAQELFAP